MVEQKKACYERTLTDDFTIIGEVIGGIALCAGLLYVMWVTTPAAMAFFNSDIHLADLTFTVIQIIGMGFVTVMTFLLELIIWSYPKYPKSRTPLENEGRISAISGIIAIWVLSFLFGQMYEWANGNNHDFHASFLKLYLSFLILTIIVSPFLHAHEWCNRD